MIQGTNIINTTTATTSASISDIMGGAVIQGVVSTTSTNISSSVSATFAVQGSLDKTNWVTLTRISLYGNSSNTDGCVISAGWAYYRVDVTEVGVDCILNIMIGEES